MAINKDRYDVVVQALENHFGRILTEFETIAFFEFANKNFDGIAKFEKAAKLVMEQETNYGKFPAYQRFAEVMNEYLRDERMHNTAAYLPAPLHQLPPSAERGVDRWSEPYTAGDVARLKAKVHVCTFFKSPNVMPKAKLLLDETKDEALKRGIPLTLIGL